METSINIAPENLKEFTETTLSCAAKSKVTFNTNPFETTTVKAPVYGGFTDVALKILTSAVDISKFTTVDAKTSTTIVWISISRTAKSEYLFEPFKRAGLYIPKIVFGVCYETETFYTNTKLCKELGRLGDVHRRNIFAYLYSITKFIINIQEKPVPTTVGFLGCFNVCESVEEFASRFPKFDADCSVTYYVKDASAEDLKSIGYDNKGLSKVSCSYTPTSGIKFAVITFKEKTNYGLVSVKVAANQYTFLVGKDTISTDYDLCMLELNEDSVCTMLASCAVGSTTIKHSDKLEFDKNFSVQASCLEDALESSPKWLIDWCKRIYSNRIEYAELEDLKYLAPYGVTFGESLCAGDADAVREKYKDDEYAQELYKQTHTYYEKFDLGNLNANVKGFSNGQIYSMIFVGASGTGKSTAARVLPTRCGFPYISVNFSVNIEESDLFGTMIPNYKKTTADDPEFIWQDGVLTKAVRNGYCAVLEEINFARPGVLGKLNSLLDENRQIDLPNGEVLHAHPNFRLIATCNISYEGTNRFNKALINRFDDVTVFEDPSRESAIKIIRERTGYDNSAKLGKIYDVYEALKKFANEQGVDAVISMRQLLNIFTKGKYYKDAKDAVNRIMLNGAFIEDEEYKKVFIDTVLPAFDLKFKI